MNRPKLRICLATSMHPSSDARIFERTAVGLASLGHHVTLVVPEAKDYLKENVRIKAIPIRSRLFKHLLGPIEAFLRVKKTKADIYHFFNPNMMPLMKSWAMHHRVFIDVHENYEVRVDFPEFPKPLRKILITLYRFLETNLCKSFQGITVVSRSMAQKLAPAGRPTLILDNVPYLGRMKGASTTTEKEAFPTIITSGINSRERNCIRAIEALPLIQKSIPNIQMKFVGSFYPRDFEGVLKKKAQELSMSNHVVFEGMLPYLQNFQRLSKAHLGCVFYEDNLNNRVTIPNRLYEYMYCGLAVLGEDFPEVRRVIGESNCGELVNSNDPNDIAEKAISLLNNREKLNSYMTNAKTAIVTKHNFELALKSLEEFYYEQIAKNK